METDEVQRVLPFQLQFDKPLPFQIKIAEWNPEKDLLAMVTEDSKILLHRFNWQRLWTVSPGKCITSLCWRPDGKAIAVGLEDGTILLHDVENGKLLRSIKSHTVAVVCLNWEEDRTKSGLPSVEYGFDNLSEKQNRKEKDWRREKLFSSKNFLGKYLIYEFMLMIHENPRFDGVLEQKFGLLEQKILSYPTKLSTPLPEGVNTLTLDQKLPCEGKLLTVYIIFILSMPNILSFSIGSQDDCGSISTYEDRTSRFFPPAPVVPRMPGVVPGDTGFMDESEDSFRELSNSSHQRFNILCSGDKDGSVCFSIFGIFPIGKVVS
ncbi:hypothetical protein U1Q18_009094 [Sarracenia purpurea var. burkii]